MKLESIGKVIAAGFGDRVMIGIIMGFLDNVSPARCYEYIKDGTELGYWISESKWQRYRKLAKQANIADITKEKIIDELGKHRLDLLGVILNDPQGDAWLENQIIRLRRKLEVDSSPLT